MYHCGNGATPERTQTIYTSWLIHGQPCRSLWSSRPLLNPLPDTYRRRYLRDELYASFFLGPAAVPWERRPVSCQACHLTEMGSRNENGRFRGQEESVTQKESHKLDWCVPKTLDPRFPKQVPRSTPKEPHTKRTVTHNYV